MQRTTRTRSGEAGYSLIEMMVSMAILAVLMLVIFRFFGNMQTAWSSSMNLAELYENARVSLDVVTRDLQAALAHADDIPGQHIRFHQPATDAVWFVSATEGGPDSSAGIIEVGYRLNNNEFQRAFVDDTHASWNVYGARDDASSQDGYQRVVGGVTGLSFTCYDRTMTAYVPNTLETETALPSMVTVVLVLMDGKAFQLWQRLPEERRPAFEQRMTRTFRKTVFLGGRTWPAP